MQQRCKVLQEGWAWGHRRGPTGPWGSRPVAGGVAQWDQTLKKWTKIGFHAENGLYEITIGEMVLYTL